MQGPFQVGMKEVEMESAERCRHVPVRLEHRIPRGAPDGTFLGKVRSPSEPVLCHLNLGPPSSTLDPTQIDQSNRNLGHASGAR